MRQTFDFYWGYVSREARLPSSGSEYKLLNIFEFIKAVSDTVLDMINAVYRLSSKAFDFYLGCNGYNALIIIIANDNNNNNDNDNDNWIRLSIIKIIAIMIMIMTLD